MNTKDSILILCTSNSARSQMAEGFFNREGGGRFEVYSAGLHPTEVHPLAIQVMKEVGVDISQNRSKSVSEYLGKKSFRYVISVCQKASDQCPRLFPGALHILHWPFEDPASFEGNEEQRLVKFRDVRDQIQRKIQLWFKAMQ